MEEITIVLFPSTGKPNLFDVVAHKPFRFVAAKSVPLDEAKRISNNLFKLMLNKESRDRLEKIFIAKCT